MPSLWAIGFSPVVPLSSPRLILRALQNSDAEALLMMDMDPRVTEFLGPMTPSLKATQEWIENLNSTYPEGFSRGFWAAELDGEIIGWFHLRPARDTGETELGYRLRHKFWGRGLATEGAKILIEHAAERVIARTMVGNNRSRRVMENVGMQPVREFEVAGIGACIEYATIPALESQILLRASSSTSNVP